MEETGVIFILDNYKIIIAGGGTGGHLYPAIAIGEEIKERLPNAQIHFVGSIFGLEAKVYPVKDLLHTLLPIRGLQRNFSIDSILKNFILPFRLIKSLIKVRKLFKDFSPNLIIGTGGYASAMPLLVATRQNPPVPIILQEQNSYPGLITRWFSKRANLICLAFNIYDNKTNERAILTGNPIRNNIMNGNKLSAINQHGLVENKKTIFIFGGSQGSSFLNKSIASVVNNFNNNSIQILWQTGDKEYQIYKKYINQSIKVVPFINDMASAYAISDLVICRSGALTLSEITICGKPSILIPFASAAGNHQLKNAKTLFDAGAGIIIEEKNLNSKKLLNTINKLLSDEKQLNKMSIASKNLGSPNATQNIVDNILEVRLNV